jgi:O-antigen biosynthesis protein WbqP
MQKLETEMPLKYCPKYWQWPSNELPSRSSVAANWRGFECVKRMTDLVCSVATLLVTSPLLILIALLIRISSPGPAIFWSTRYGRCSDPFRMPKFRTMYSNAPEVPSIALRYPEKYITPIGRVLRKTSLDELPQFWSVLVGDMSLVGPRPVICAEVELAEMRACIGIDRLSPGITGWAQINGRDSVSVEEKVLLDHYYLLHRSIQMDIRIVYETINYVLSGDGIVH